MDKKFKWFNLKKIKYCWSPPLRKTHHREQPAYFFKLSSQRTSSLGYILIWNILFLSENLLLKFSENKFVSFPIELISNFWMLQSSSFFSSSFSMVDEKHPLSIDFDWSVNLKSNTFSLFVVALRGFLSTFLVKKDTVSLQGMSFLSLWTVLKNETGKRKYFPQLIHSTQVQSLISSHFISLCLVKDPLRHLQQMDGRKICL